MSIEFTNHCNFKCVQCPQSVHGQRQRDGNTYTRDKGYLSDDVFDVFLDNARKYAKSVTVGFFGEPTLHPKFSEYMSRLAQDRTYKLIVFSNWSLFSQNIFKSLMKCGVVKISLDASHKSLFDKLCPEGDYYSIESNIRIWLAVKNHPKTYLVYMVSSLNEHDIEDFLKKWTPKLLKSDSIIAKSVISYGGVMKDSYMTANKCRILQKPRLVVSWNGYCSPCNLDVDMSMSTWNILQIPDLKRLVSTEEYQDTLNDIRNKYHICANCFDANNHRKTTIHRGRADA